MKKNRLSIVKIIFILAFAIAGVLIIRYCIPSQIYTAVGRVGGSIDRTTQYSTVSDEICIDFYPEENYIGTIKLYFYDISNEDNEIYPKAEASVYNSQDRKITEGIKQILYPNSFLNIPVNSLVRKGKQYSVKVILPENVSINLKNCPKEDGPAEEVQFSHDGIVEENNCYMEIYYGIYSKKLLVIWMGIFALGGSFLTGLFDKKEEK